VAPNGAAGDAGHRVDRHRALDAELSSLQHVDVDRLPIGASLGPLVFEDSRLARPRPALKIGDRARIGRVYFEKIARTHCINLFLRLNDWHRALEPFRVENLYGHSLHSSCIVK
jgi:hypothetical protein